MITYQQQKGLRTKVRFRFIEHMPKLEEGEEVLFIVKSGKWIDHDEWEKNKDDDGFTTLDICKSIRAFRRRLRKIGKFQPHLKGKKFKLKHSFMGYDAYGTVK